MQRRSPASTVWNPARYVNALALVRTIALDLLGQEVNTIREWAQVLADSDEFARMVTRMFWQHAIGRDPKLSENEEFAGLWQAFPELGYNAEALLHAMIDTHAFGAP